MTVSTDLASVIEAEPGRPPVLTVAANDAVDAAAWAERHGTALRGFVAEHGALLVRGAGLGELDRFRAVFAAVGSEPVDDTEGFAQRRRHDTGVYSSVAWPDSQLMCMHHELSYRSVVPTLLMFGCVTAPASGGATALADAGAVLDALPADLVRRFESDGWLLHRVYGGDVGPTVADAFGTDSPDAVAAYCRANGILATPQPDGTLRTSQRRPAVVRHPVTGRRCWFNQIAFLSEWTLDEEVREFLVEMNGPDGLPFTTAYGDGSPVGADVVALINEVYDAHTVREPWRAGDLLIVDNVATAHNREPYTGPREILVGLADPQRSETLGPVPGAPGAGR